MLTVSPSTASNAYLASIHGTTKLYDKYFFGRGANINLDSLNVISQTGVTLQIAPVVVFPVELALVALISEIMVKMALVDNDRHQW